MERRTLKTLLPQLETDWLLPAWLLLAVLSAFVAEVWIIGQGVVRVYGLMVGWPIGVTVASTQALGSMMYSNASAHNARRKLVYQRRRKNESLDAPRREDVQKSEPRLVTGLPFAISVCAGVASALVGLALYQADGGLGVLDGVLAVASPAGSIMAALLNGVFMSGQEAVRLWGEGQREGKRVVGVAPVVPMEVPIKPRKRRAAIGETRQRARMILAERPDISGTELGQLLGRSGGYGRQLKRAIVSENGKQRAIEIAVVE
jgi:hypothetical protein